MPWVDVKPIEVIPKKSILVIPIKKKVCVIHYNKKTYWILMARSIRGSTAHVVLMNRKSRVIEVHAVDKKTEYKYLHY